MFIPVAVGLLDSSGKDIPLTSIYHDGKLLQIGSSDSPVYTTVLRVTKVRSVVLLFKIHILFRYISLLQFLSLKAERSRVHIQ